MILQTCPLLPILQTPSGQTTILPDWDHSNLLTDLLASCPTSLICFILYSQKGILKASDHIISCLDLFNGFQLLLGKNQNSLQGKESWLVLGLSPSQPLPMSSPSLSPYYTLSLYFSSLSSTFLHFF